MNTDTLEIRKLALTCSIGVYEWERQAPQHVLVDVDLPLEVAAAAAKDQLEDTLDYTRLVSCLRSVASARHYNLLETLAERMAENILGEFGVAWVRICVDKPLAIAEARATRICIERKA
jgi:7,8-dihydroneopterin aldolase/epimerase/oxygenase